MRNATSGIVSLASRPISRNVEQAITDSAPRRREFETATAQLDAALDYTRPQRVHALMSDPSPDLVKRLGEPPASATGRAVWCHHALPIEAALDRNDGVSPPRTGWSQHDDRARQEIAVADRLLEAKSAVTNPTEWAELAQQAGTHPRTSAQRPESSHGTPARRCHQPTRPSTISASTTQYALAGPK